jgi:DNA invertase Pin-like site-specific DNA recombinase
MNCILFTRTSTATNPHDEQVDALTTICQEKGWQAKLTYKEVGSGLISGNQRPTLTKMLKDIPQNPAIDCIMVTNISRLSCKPKDIQKLMQWLHTKNISIYIANLDLLSVGNEEAFMEQADLAEQQITELKQTIVQKNRVKIGRKEGWKKPIKRYQNDHQDIIDLLNAGESIRKIGHTTGKSTTTIQKIKRIMIQTNQLTIHATPQTN